MVEAAAKEDPGRIDLLLRLAERTLRIDPEEGYELVIEAVNDATRLSRPTSSLYRTLAEAAELCGDLHGAIDALEKGIRVATGEPVVGAHLHMELVRLFRLIGEYPRALEHAREAIDLYRQVDDQAGEAFALKGLADLYAGVGDIGHALGFYFDALRTAEQADAGEISGICLCDIALLQSEQGDHQRAIEHLLRARELFSTAGLRRFEVRTLANLASVSAAAGEYRSGLDYGLRAMAIYQALDDRTELATTLANLSRIYQALDDPTGALECNRKAYDLFELVADDLGRGTVLLNSGMVYHATGEYQSAIFIAEQGLEVATAAGEERLQLECHELLSRSFEAIGDPERSLKHLREAIAIRDSIEREERRRGLADLQAQYDLERAEKEREIYRLKNEQLESENRHKTEELTSISMRLIENSRFLNDVRREIERVRDGLREEERREIDEILQKIRQNSNRDQAWELFEEQFRKVHHDFTDRLARRAPDLTQTELKVSALIKAGLSSNEIASLFHVTKRNIDTHRYRLRKKLDIPTETSLAAWFAKV